MPAKPRYKLPTEESLTRAAVHYLERYASSETNLNIVLQRKIFRICHTLGQDPVAYLDMIDTVVAKCVRIGLVNDRQFAETKISSLRRKGASQRKIESQLAAKGVGHELILSLMSEDPHDDSIAAKKYARRRRLGPYRDPFKRLERRDKDLAAMCRAGFSFEIARQVIDADGIGSELDPTR
ncbi:MAG: regulatory protein RecX [Roseibium sp.]